MITFEVFSPLRQGGGDLFALDTSRVSAYQHTLTAEEGFKEASLTYGASVAAIEDWLEFGLGRHVEVYGEDGQVAFEGFVNEVTARLGGASLSRGPLLAVSNYAYAAYTPLDTSVSPPVKGTQTISAASEDAVSRAAYGTLEYVLSVGDATDADASYALGLFLQDNAWPAYNLELSEPAAPELVLQISGYWAWLDRVYYSEAATGTVVVSDPVTPPYGKLQQVLSDAAVVNSWQVSTDWSGMGANAILAPNYEGDSRTAWAIVKELVSLGDAGGNRWTFGLYSDRKAFYAAAPTAAEYYTRLRNNTVTLEDANGNAVKPWLARPGKWLEFTDLLPGRGVPTDIRRDPRAEFVEAVTYTLPVGLALTGRKIHSLDQVLAQMGLGSM